MICISQDVLSFIRQVHCLGFFNKSEIEKHENMDECGERKSCVSAHAYFYAYTHLCVNKQACQHATYAYIWAYMTRSLTKLWTVQLTAKRYCINCTRFQAHPDPKELPFVKHYSNAKRMTTRAHTLFDVKLGSFLLRKQIPLASSLFHACSVSLMPHPPPPNPSILSPLWL